MPSLSEETNGRIERLMPGATIGIIGGGQLGRMMALSARYMGFRIGVLDPTPDCPAAQVADFQVTAEYDDIAAIRELAEKSDVLTYEFENVDADAIDQVRSLAAAPQGTDLLRVTQDRVNEKRFINDHGTPTAPWKAVNSVEELEAALDEIHYPAVLKTRSGGYDGHGQTVLKSEADLEQVRARADHDGSFPPSILEGFVDFAFEASILVAGNGKDYVTFPIVRNEHRNNTSAQFRPLHHRGLLVRPVRRAHSRHRRLAARTAAAAQARRHGQRARPACGADPCAHRRPSRMERARLLQGGSAPRPQDGTHHRADRRHRQNRSRP